MQFSATQIAALLDGEVDGDAQVLVSDLAKIEEVLRSFYRLRSSSLSKAVRSSRIRATNWIASNRLW